MANFFLNHLLHSCWEYFNNIDPRIKILIFSFDLQGHTANVRLNNKKTHRYPTRLVTTIPFLTY
jgi:hypothetical protein